MALPLSFNLSMNSAAPATLTAFEKFNDGKYTDTTPARDYIAPQHIIIEGMDASKPNADISLLFKLVDNVKVSFVSSGGGQQDTILKCDAYTVFRIQRPKLNMGAYSSSNPFTAAYLKERSYSLDQLVRVNAAAMLDRALRGER